MPDEYSEYWDRMKDEARYILDGCQHANECCYSDK